MVQNSVPLVSRLAWASPASPGPHQTGERGGCRGALPERTLPEGRSWTIVKWGNSLEEEVGRGCKFGVPYCGGVVGNGIGTGRPRGEYSQCSPLPGSGLPLRGILQPSPLARLLGRWPLLD